jgi:murein L,D-transpeptidase YcbB/YkuD
MIGRWLAVVVLAAVPLAAGGPLAAGVVLADAAPLADAAAPLAAWNTSDARALSSVIGGIAQDGLDPADYDLAALDAALAGGVSSAINVAASRSFRRLAADLAQGHVRGSSRINWFIAGPVVDAERLDSLESRALAGDQVAATLQGLLPQGQDYRALKAALAATPATDLKNRNRLRVNMERWRWLPRTLGDRVVFVNVPAFTASLQEAGTVVARYRVIIGKTTTPTPQFSTVVKGVILNPWWEVPASIVAESVGVMMRREPARARSQGYVRVATPGGGTRVRQAPGPRNALGQMKLVMINPYSIYMHDTPSKALFEKPVRAFSHGCIRVDTPIDFAARLLVGTDRWDRPTIDAAVARGAEARADLAAPVPVYIAYFTAMRAADGSIASYPDIYHRDEAVIAALTDREGESLSE